MAESLFFSLQLLAMWLRLFTDTFTDPFPYILAIILRMREQ